MRPREAAVYEAGHPPPPGSEKNRSVISRRSFGCSLGEGQLMWKAPTVRPVRKPQTHGRDFVEARRHQKFRALVFSSINRVPVSCSARTAASRGFTAVGEARRGAAPT